MRTNLSKTETHTHSREHRYFIKLILKGTVKTFVHILYVNELYIKTSNAAMREREQDMGSSSKKPNYLS